MTNHYFIDDGLSGELIPLKVNFFGQEIEVMSQAGLFSATSVDFGSLFLATTAIKYVTADSSILDLGSGNGMVGVLLGKATACRVVMSDINRKAVATSQVNINVHRLHNARAVLSDGFEQINEQFDLILFNPPISAGKQVYYPLVRQARDYLNQGGQLLIVIRKDKGALPLVRYLQESGYLTIVIDRKKGYHLISCQIPGR